jgi:hypothetical protein
VCYSLKLTDFPLEKSKIKDQKLKNDGIARSAGPSAPLRAKGYFRAGSFGDGLKKRFLAAFGNDKRNSIGFVWVRVGFELGLFFRKKTGGLRPESLGDKDLRR